MSGEQSIDQAAERSQRLPSERIARLDFQRLLEAAHGVAVHLFPKVRASQIVMRKMPRLVAARFRGTLEPGNRVVKAILFDQVGPDVVVGVAKIGIDLDGALALGDGLLDAALEMIGPTEKGVRLGGGVHFEGKSVKLDGAIVIAFHLRLVGVLQDFPRAREGVQAHKA